MRILALWLLCMSWTAALAGDAVRVLVDVSGSMKQNDPRNLRAPALKLLLELLPPGTEAGVWLFADDAEALLPPAPVDERWKREAENLTARIHSRGRHTDIEQALTAATREWQAPDESGRRHLILLTDGMVDVAGDATADDASRRRILTRLLPRLQRAGVRLYTIALSSQADHALLKQLAVATDGWNETAASAEQLHRSFLKIFANAVPRNTLPLEDNRFQVDSSVREFTLLVLRRPDSPPTELVKPSGQRWSFDDHPENVRWRHEDAYDLITVSDPLPGSWQVVAAIDPDNRVMIVTDLKLKVAPLPNFLIASEPLTIEAELTDHGERITKERFLRLVRLQLERQDLSTPQPLNPEEDGRFTLDVTPLAQPGTYTFSVTADGKTFQRRWQQSVEVIANPIRLEKTQTDGEAVLRLTPDPKVVDPKSFQAEATVAEKTIPFSPIGEGVWEARIPLPAEPMTVNLQVRANDRKARPLSIAFKPIELTPAAAEPEETPAEEEASLEEEEELLEEEEMNEAYTPNWWLAAAIAGAVNLILGLAGFLGWRWFRRNGEKRRQAILERLA